MVHPYKIASVNFNTLVI